MFLNVRLSRLLTAIAGGVTRPRTGLVATGLAFALAAAAATVASCGSPSSPSIPSTPSSPSAESGSTANDDAALFRRLTVTDPLGSYTVFPNAEPFTTGRLNGSEAHRPVIRVMLNATAASALAGGQLTSGARFPDGSIIVKEIRTTSTAPPTLYAVMVKDRANPLAGNGWLWAEYGPSGSVTYPVASRGGACTSCHLRENGPDNDLVRSFERQR